MIGDPAISTSDEAITAVVTLVLNDLCFGETQALRVHVDGAREMVMARGGLAALGGQHDLAKMVLVADLATAIAVDTSPSFSEAELAAYTQSLTAPLASTPNGTTNPPNPAPLSNIALPHTPNLNPATTAMLNDTTFLIDTALNLPPNPPHAQLQKVLAMSNWVQGRLSAAAATTTTTTTTTINPTINPNITATPTTNMTAKRNPSAALHRAVRLSSQLYCRAIQTRQPLASVARPQDALDLVEAVRAVQGGIWDGTCRSGGGGMLRTLVSVLVVVLPVMLGGDFNLEMGSGSGGLRYGDGDGYGYGYGYGGRGLVVAAVVRLAMVDWPGAVRVLGRVVRLQAWLRGAVGGG
ncbi:uncharacterized protein B0H64DRAFT_447166 [Chaetomium fimeti]|uniref:Uncharacterized protein n=1 Tax=Chaetomium fimeti TaxID=1854472 RepID=A0AAE0H5M8_9PEZI|nr:hypothetical protein B0H64DRAFT_447166 [Chaetomium fimeti]